MSLETEITLAIVSDDPEKVFQDLSDLNSLAGHELRPAAPQSIHDTYFDTETGDLRKNGWALRIRRVEGVAVWTLKGPKRRSAGGGVERIELEAPWSSSSFEDIFAALREKGVDLTPASTCPGAGSPAEGLRTAGLEVIQERFTNRQVRHVFVSTCESAIAEMDLDRVTYGFPGGRVVHLEVEIEAKTRAGKNALKELSDRLLSLFPRNLRPWDHGKLATGRVLGRLLEHSSWSDRVTADSHLAPSVYEEMEQRFQRR